MKYGKHIATILLIVIILLSAAFLSNKNNVQVFKNQADDNLREYIGNYTRHLRLIEQSIQGYLDTGDITYLGTLQLHLSRSVGSSLYNPTEMKSNDRMFDWNILHSYINHVELANQEMLMLLAQSETIKEKDSLLNEYSVFLEARKNDMGQMSEQFKIAYDDYAQKNSGFSEINPDAVNLFNEMILTLYNTMINP